MLIPVWARYVSQKLILMGLETKLWSCLWRRPSQAKAVYELKRQMDSWSNNSFLFLQVLSPADCFLGFLGSASLQATCERKRKLSLQLSASSSVLVWLSQAPQTTLARIRLEDLADCQQPKEALLLSRADHSRIHFLSTAQTHTLTLFHEIQTNLSPLHQPTELFGKEGEWGRSQQLLSLFMLRELLPTLKSYRD